MFDNGLVEIQVDLNEELKNRIHFLMHQLQLYCHDVQQLHFIVKLCVPY